MARKQTYRQRFTNNIIEADNNAPQQKREPRTRVPVNPELQQEYLEGKAYLVQHSIPNFYFHITTAYSILRSQGMNIGKVDFLGNQDWKNSTK